MTKPVRWVGLVVFLAICLGAGGLGALATTPEIAGWYKTLNKPAWTPPDQIFGPVWTTLYILMAISGWLIWQRGGVRAAAVPLTWFGGQLVLNVVWSWLFFGQHQPGWAFVEVILLWLAILGTLITFSRRSLLAAALLLPYLIWVSFAAGLNFAIWQMN